MTFILNKLAKACPIACSNAVFKKCCLSQIKSPSYFVLSSGQFRGGVKFYSSNDGPKDTDSPIYPALRVWRMLKNDMTFLRQVVDGEVPDNKLPYHFPSHCDILVVGGGVIGSSIAYWLKQRALSGLSVVVVEKDSSVINFNRSEVILDFND